MIERVNYSLFMKTLIELVGQAEEGPDFEMAIKSLIISSYEINNPEHGKCEVVDVTADLIESMGRHWAALAKVGVQEVAFVRFYLEDDLVCEAGRILGTHSDHTVAIQELTSMPEPVLRAFAKAMTLAMRKYDIQILKEMMEGTFDKDDPNVGDNLGLNRLIHQFLDEEVDETVAKFSSQLDAVFGVADIPRPWSAPEGPRMEAP